MAYDVTPLRQQAADILFITQVYPPDPAAVGQQLADVAANLAGRGLRVTVLTADRGYDDPAIRYPRREVRDGVRIVRLPWSSFGKNSMVARLLGGMSFLLQATVRALFARHLSRVVVTTVPVISPACGAVLAMTRRVGVIYWIMDLNPDQLVALGVVGPRSPLVRALRQCNLTLLRRARAIIVCDEYMAKRVRNTYDPVERLHVVTPWAHDSHLEPVTAERNPFLAAHALSGRRVIMYSGNHALTNPLTTLLDAAERLSDHPRLVFVFVGGGAGKREVEARRLPNVLSLPYQPLDQIKYSLSAADVHVVTIGPAVVGIVHPCKIYGAMAVGRPIISFGPPHSHVADIVHQGIGWHFEHGDVDGAVAALKSIADLPAAELAAMGARARVILAERFDSRTARTRISDLIDPRKTETRPERGRFVGAG
jgi:glycosyltransferase involved in cell wall biosynthesis